MTECNTRGPTMKQPTKYELQHRLWETEEALELADDKVRALTEENVRLRERILELERSRQGVYSEF